MPTDKRTPHGDHRGVVSEFWITPDWPAPATVRALSTTRIGGVSPAPFASLNLATHVGDHPEHVARNRALVRSQLALPQEPNWLDQVHGVRVIDPARESDRCADAATTSAPRTVCVVMTADCLPLLLCDRGGRSVGAAHAGWRGLAAGLLEQTVAAMQSPPDELIAWLGPAIGPDAFEVGSEVVEAFTRHDPNAAEAFQAHRPGHWLADLYQLARQRLTDAGVTAIFGGERCTFSEEELFFSYRRDGRSGRMASLIWLD